VIAGATDWITALVGPVDAVELVRERPWGSVVRARAAGRAWWLKAPGLHARHELALLPIVGALGPEVVAVDEQRGWVLLADHGVPMRDVLDGPGQVAVLEALLPAYAQLQRATRAAIPDVVPDRSPRRLPDLVSGLGIAQADLHVLRRVCDDLAATPVALDHGDIHGTNVLVAGADTRLVDWGDACVSHPFSSLLVPLEHVASLVPGADRRLRDAYLEPWGADADLEECALAVWVGSLARVVSNVEQWAGDPGGDDEIATLLRRWHDSIPLLSDPEALLRTVAAI
jgi:hypothetical protein